MEPKGSLECLQEPVTGLLPEPAESSSHPHIYFLNIRFNIIHPPNVIAEWLTLQLRIVEVPASNLGP
jgi:hypothetical protein